MIGTSSVRRSTATVSGTTAMPKSFATWAIEASESCRPGSRPRGTPWGTPAWCTSFQRRLIDADSDVTYPCSRPNRRLTNIGASNASTDPARGMGLRPRVPLRSRPRSRLPRLAPSLQSPPRPHRTQRQVTSRPRAQPVRTEHLGRQSTMAGERRRPRRCDARD